VLDKAAEFFKFTFNLLCILVVIGVLWYAAYWGISHASYHAQKYYADNKESIQQAPENVLNFLKPKERYKGE
jgi:hypothetical protein